MYTIDLLKGEGVPIRSRPGGIAFVCLLLVVPLLAGVTGMSIYLDNQVVIAIQSQQVSKLTQATDTLSAAVQKKQTLEEEKTQTVSTLSDVKAALAGHTPWSPVLACLTESLADTLVLTKLEARLNTVRQKVPAKDDPSTKVEVSLPVRELRICVCGRDPESSSEAVRKLQETLRSAAALGPRLDTITVSQNATTLDRQEAVQYELNCMFKPVVQ